MHNLDDNIVCMDKIVLEKKCIECIGCIEGEVFWDEGEVEEVGYQAQSKEVEKVEEAEYIQEEVIMD